MYKTVPLDYDLTLKTFPVERDLNFSASSQDGADVTMEVLPPEREGVGSGAVQARERGHLGGQHGGSSEAPPATFAIRRRDPPQGLRPVRPAEGPAPSVFQYAKNALHGPRTVGLGTRPPSSLTLGVNSAFEDVGVLRSASVPA